MALATITMTGLAHPRILQYGRDPGSSTYPSVYCNLVSSGNRTQPDSSTTEIAFFAKSSISPADTRSLGDGPILFSPGHDMPQHHPCRSRLYKHSSPSSQILRASEHHTCISPRAEPRGKARRGRTDSWYGSPLLCTQKPQLQSLA